MLKIYKGEQKKIEPVDLFNPLEFRKNVEFVIQDSMVYEFDNFFTNCVI